DTDVTERDAVEPLIGRLLADAGVEYIDATTPGEAATRAESTGPSVEPQTCRGGRAELVVPIRWHFDLVASCPPGLPASRHVVHVVKAVRGKDAGRHAGAIAAGTVGRDRPGPVDF